MPDERDDVDRTNELFEFLQGRVPEGYRIAKSDIPQLSPEQAWTVIWYLGNQYWDVKDFIERCDVCGRIFNSENEGNVLDFGNVPYHFCGNCEGGSEYRKKLNTRTGRKYAKDNELTS